MPSPVYFTVVADFKAFVEDASSDADYNPQEVPISATVTFTPLFNSGDVALATTATPRPIGYLPTPVVAVIDPADGRLKLRTTADAGGTGTFAPVRLLGSSSFLELDGPLYYEVSFSNVTYNNNRTSIAGFTFEAPSSDTELNLITVMRKPGEVASGITKISPGGVRVEGNTLVFTFDGADIPDPLPLSNFVGPAGSISIGTVTTGAAYSSATITNVGTPQAAVLDFTVPQGIPGATNTAPDTNAAQSKTTPVDADELPLVDSASSFSLKKLTWANLKTAIGSWYDTATRTLTNKTLASPNVSGSASLPATIAASGSDANIGVNLLTKGSGTVQANGIDVVTTTAVQTLSGKTLASPTINTPSMYAIRNSGGATALLVTGVNSATTSGNCVGIEATAGDAEIWGWHPTNADANLNIRTKGSGVVKVNGSPVVTTTGSQVLTNKTISGSSNTVTNLPASATPDAARLVCATAAGGITAEDGPNTWAKIATFSTGTSAYTDMCVLLSVSNWSTNGHDAAIVSVLVRSNGTGTNPTVGVEIIAKSGAGGQILADSFKIISGGWSTNMELWVRKGGNYGGFKVYELSRSATGVTTTVTYNQNGAWQSAVPTGTVNNVSSNGVTAFGVPVVTSTNTVTMTNKSLTAPKIDQINDSNGATNTVFGAVASATNYLQINNGTSAPTIFSKSATNANVDLALQAKGAGLIYLNGNTAVSKVSVPATATSTGVVGQTAWDENYFYVCTATNTWRRAPLATW